MRKSGSTCIRWSSYHRSSWKNNDLTSVAYIAGGSSAGWITATCKLNKRIEQLSYDNLVLWEQQEQLNMLLHQYYIKV
jgi:hypothetical protein